MTVFNHVAKRSLALFVVTTMAGYIYSMGCGSSGTATTDTTTSGVSVSATVTTPSASSNLAVGKSVGKAISEAAAADLIGIYYDADGETLGTCTSDSAGKCALTVTSTEALRDSTVDASAAEFTTRVVLVAASTDESVERQLYCEATVTASTTSVDCGTADGDADKAARKLLKKMGLTAWGEKFVDKFSDFDPLCYVKVWEKTYEDSGLTSESSLAIDVAVTDGIVDAAMALGHTPSTYGVTTWQDLQDQVDAGTFPISTHAATLGAALGVDAAVLTDNYADGVTARGHLETIFDDRFAAGSGLTALASTSTAKSTGDDDSGCDAVKDASIGDSYASGLVSMLLNSSSASALATYATDDSAFKLMLGLMEEYKDAGDYAPLLTGDAGAACAGYLEGIGAGGYDAYLNGGVLDATKIDGMFAIFNTLDGADLSHDEILAWGGSWENTVAAADNGFEDFKSGGTFDTTMIGAYADYFESSVQEGTDLTIVNWNSLESDLESSYLGGATTGTALLQQAPGTEHLSSGTVPTPTPTPTPTQASVSAGTYTISGEESCQNGAEAPEAVAIVSGALTGIGPSSQEITASSATVCSFGACQSPATCTFTSSSVTFTGCQFGMAANQTCTVTYTK